MPHVVEEQASGIPPLTCQDPRVSIGEFTYGNPRLLLWADAERIEIGKHCSIAEETVIMGGDVPPYTIVADNPASVVRKRFSEPQINDLLKIKWWNWPTRKIREHLSLLGAPDIDAFIEEANKQPV